MPKTEKSQKRKAIDIEQHESSSDESDSEQQQQQQPKETLKRKAEEEPEQQHVSKKATTGNSLFVGQLNKKATRQEIHDFFSQAGTVVDVRMKKTMKNRENNPGYCHVEMGSPEEKEAALKLHGTSFQGFKLNLDDASNFKPKARNDKLSAPSNTLFVANLPFEADRDYVKLVFEKYGDIERVSRIMAKGYDTGIAYVEFKEMKHAVTALQSMQGESIKGRPIRLDYAEKRKNNKPHPLKKKNFVKEQRS